VRGDKRDGTLVGRAIRGRGVQHLTIAVGRGPACDPGRPGLRRATQRLLTAREHFTPCLGPVLGPFDFNAPKQAVASFDES
jgi:hypothetical protein